MLTPSRVADLSALPSRLQASLVSLRKQQLQDHQPLQIGVSRSVAQPVIRLSQLKWQRSTDGSQMALMEIKSALAEGLRAHLQLSVSHDRNAYVSAIQLNCKGRDQQIFSDTWARFSPDRAGWSPIVAGDLMQIEIKLPRQIPSEHVHLQIDHVAHLDTSPTARIDDLSAHEASTQVAIARK